MKRVTSLGGIYFRTLEAEKTRKGYSRYPGMNMEEQGTHFVWRNPGDPEQWWHTQ